MTRKKGDKEHRKYDRDWLDVNYVPDDDSFYITTICGDKVHANPIIIPVTAFQDALKEYQKDTKSGFDGFVR